MSDSVDAPNLTKLVGKELAEKLIDSAGSLRELSITPADNVLIFGESSTI